MSESVIYTVEKGVATLQIHRPEVLNSCNRALLTTLRELLARGASDTSVRALVLTGTGKAFCAGQDLTEVIADKEMDFNKTVQDYYNPLIQDIRHLEKPVVAAVNGVAAGAGANIALACDIVVAKASACFIQAFSKIGLVPDSGGTYFLPRLVGWQRASALMMLGDKVFAPQAKDMGMIYDYFPDTSFEEEVRALAGRLAQMPTKGLAYTKMLLNQSFAHTLSVQLAQEGLWQAKAGATEDYREGVRAFLEKRSPKFKGQ